MADVGHTGFVMEQLRRIEQDAIDLHRDLANDSIDTAGISGRLDRIEEQARLGLAGVKAIEASIRAVLR